MKRFLTITVIALTLLVFTACGDSKSNKDNKDTGDTDTDVVDTDTTDTTPEGDTTPSGDTDTDTAPSGDTDADTTPEGDTDTNTDTDTDTDTDADTEGPASKCTGLSLDWSTFAQYQYKNQFVATNDDYSKLLKMLIFHEETINPGTYDLGSETNSGLDCSECILAYTDPDEESGYYSRSYFQKSGTLKIDKVDENLNITGTLSVVLAEIEIDEDSEAINFLPDGACLEIETASFDSGYEEECVPHCEEGWECGDNGCGGTCGDGCNGQACSEDHTCVDFECTKLTIGEAFLSGTSMYAPVEGNAAGESTIEDFLSLRFYDYPVLGTFDLGLSFDDCDYCMLLYEDVDSEGYPSKLYFQESGTLTFTEVYEDSLESKGNASFRLVEINNDYEPVDGGKCYEVENFTWDTVCVPQCEGKVCGPDGCGGTCGEGCGADLACSEDQTECVARTCTEITLDASAGTFTSGDGMDLYKTTFSPFIGEEDADDDFRMQFYASVTGTQDLAGTNYADCDLCLLVFEDLTESGSRTREYFQQKGTVTFSTEGDTVSAVFSGVRLEEVVINWSGDYASTQVAGGACLDVKDTTLTYTATAASEAYTCEEIYDCYVACEDQACTNACYSAGSSESQEQFIDFMTCMNNDECNAIEDDDEWQDCIFEKCEDEISACFG